MFFLFIDKIITNLFVINNNIKRKKLEYQKAKKLRKLRDNNHLSSKFTNLIKIGILIFDLF